MKNSILFLFITTLFFSCKKEEQYNPSNTISYTHLYQTRSNSFDTLYSIYIPNTFSPNGDGINDYFYPEGYYHSKSFQIVDKNGNVIYENSKTYIDFIDGWNGKEHNNGQTLPLGTYIYKLNVSDATGKEYEYTGNVLLFK